MISKIFINVGSYNFCCCNRFDHSSRTTCTVSSCKYTWHIQEISSCSCHDLTTLYRNSCFCEMLCLNILTNCHNKDITWNILIWLSCCFYACTSAFDLTDHLRCNIHSFNVMIFINIQRCRGLQSLYFNSLCNCSFNLCRKSCHICNSSSIYNADFLSTQSFGCTDCIHRYITATDNCDFFSSQVKCFVFSYIS